MSEYVPLPDPGREPDPPAAAVARVLHEAG
jgi:hypothetical protein